MNKIQGGLLAGLLFLGSAILYGCGATDVATAASSESEVTPVSIEQRLSWADQSDWVVVHRTNPWEKGAIVDYGNGEPVCRTENWTQRVNGQRGTGPWVAGRWRNNHCYFGWSNEKWTDDTLYVTPSSPTRPSVTYQDAIEVLRQPYGGKYRPFHVSSSGTYPQSMIVAMGYNEYGTLRNSTDYLCAAEEYPYSFLPGRMDNSGGYNRCVITLGGKVIMYERGTGNVWGLQGPPYN